MMLAQYSIISKILPMTKIITFLIALFIPSLAYAHETALGGFTAGLIHPVLGLDHLLAMISVGVISAQIGGRAIWGVPTTFVFVMALGGALAMQYFGLGAVEIGIAMSVVVLGLTIANGSRIIPPLTYGFVALFAIYHGYAHGMEIPNLESWWPYIVGFMSGTAGLHLTGVIIGYIAEKLPHGAKILRYTGAVTAGMGLHILLVLLGI